MARTQRKKKHKVKEELINCLVVAAGFQNLHPHHQPVALRAKMRQFLRDRDVEVWDACTLEGLVKRVRNKVFRDIVEFDRFILTRDDYQRIRLGYRQHI
ncbi:MAG: hypothetical protein UY07_C0045G0010 [Parcubacteria group bacterium GW2011_GWA1_47_8]|nr:MAG: hypothetical protein UY07_C0045G0010 [Parcubacteria group bacterium GW2011_GWA1_47_8]KKW07985.1 MAG: hypothetical protein UY42_C0002G0034 [Parcubacteria group bacterium GW2011_GWA2_49_16]